MLRAPRAASLIAVGGGTALLLYLWRRRFGRRPSALRRRASIDDEEATKGAADAPTGLLYPMYVMAMDDFLALDCLAPHDELRRDGSVVAVAELEARPIHFISHQWLSTETADPTCAHLRTMQDVFRRVMAGEYVFRSEEQCQTFAKGYSTTNKLYNKHNGFPNSEDLSTENFRQAVSNGLVWLDFISVPQTAGCESPAATQQALHAQSLAIASIPAYVRKASTFWVCAPGDAPHASGHACNFDSWEARGWCRLEEVAFNLVGKLGDGRPLLVTQPLGHAPQVHTLDMMDRVWMHSQRRGSVLNGDYSCCRMGHVVTDAAGRRTEIPCDKARLRRVLERMLAETTECHRCKMLLDPLQHGERPLWDCALRSFDPAADNRGFWEHFTLQTLGKLWLADSEAEAPEEGVATADELHAFAASFGLAWPHAGPALCIPAAVRSELRVLRRLITVEEVDASLLPGGVCLGQTPLSFAARHGNLRVVDLLTTAFPGAEHINRPSSGLGLWPLGEAAKCGHPEVVTMLLERNADVHQRRRNGQTALHQAAAQGHAECVRRLCNAGADPRAVDDDGRTAADLAATELDFRHAVKAKVMGELLRASGVSYQ